MREFKSISKQLFLNNKHIPDLNKTRRGKRNHKTRTSHFPAVFFSNPLHSPNPTTSCISMRLGAPILKLPIRLSSSMFSHKQKKTSAIFRKHNFCVPNRRTIGARALFPAVFVWRVLKIPRGHAVWNSKWDDLRVRERKR